MPKDLSVPEILIELKSAGKEEKTDLAILAENASDQIHAKNYETEMLYRDVKSILKIGVAFKGKDVVIRSRCLSVQLFLTCL